MDDLEDDPTAANDETRLFRRFLSPAGDVERLDEIRRNGNGVPRPTPLCHSEMQHTNIVVLLQTYRTLMYNLNSIERRIWVPLLLGRSIDEVAKAFGVSRPALYSRIRGDGKGYGGMISKNENVEIWWRRRKDNR